MRVRVMRMTLEAEDVISFDLAPLNGESLPTWTPGAHISVNIDAKTVRHYSLCGPQHDPSVYRIAVLRESDGRGGSIALHERVRVGQMLEIGPPANHFSMQRARHYQFVAGGIGITPIIPMIEQAHAEGADWHLIYVGRSRRTMAFTNRLEQFGTRVILVDKTAQPEFSIIDHLTVDPDTVTYCCGPSRMVDALQNEFSRRETPENLVVERFKAGEPALEGESPPFTAVISSSGLEIPVPSDRTLLSCLLDAGVDVLFSCEEGTCGSCETKVLSGEIDHRDCVLNAAERGAGNRMMVCVSRARSERLILDL